MILLLGGTVDSRELAAYLTKQNLPVLLTTVSAYGGQLAADEAGVEVHAGPLSQEQLNSIIRQHKIKAIVDATHPYAAVISEQAMQVSKELEIEYCRFERPNTIMTDEQIENGLLHYVPDIQEAGKLAARLGNSIFLTIGSKWLAQFLANLKPYPQKVTARVLPDLNSIEKCLNSGLQAGDIMAMQGPFSLELNKAMFCQKGAQVLVTKDSGKAGGTDAKIAAALELGIPVVIIQRPNINYLNQFASFEEIFNFIMREVD